VPHAAEAEATEVVVNGLPGWEIAEDGAKDILKLASKTLRSGRRGRRLLCRGGYPVTSTLRLRRCLSE
jgi:hypothetical protein